MTKRKNLKTLCCLVAVPFALIGTNFVYHSAASAEEEVVTFDTDCQEEITLTNSSFNNISGDSSSGDNFSGWKMLDKNSQATGMVIDVVNNFSSKQSNYYLKGNPGKSGKDNKVLMINSQNDNSQAKSENLGYASDSITLEANSYYRLSVDALTSTTVGSVDSGAYAAYASIYVNGLKDLEGKPVELSYENINGSNWTTYYFFIATGSQEQKITLDLYLGSQTQASYGAVFFDETHLTKFSENTFYINAQDFGYEFVDNNEETGTTAKFSTILKENNTLDMNGYNFDFEAPIESANTLGDAWTMVAEKSSIGGHAQIMQVHRGVQNSYFKDVTGYDFVGNDLTYNINAKKENSQALVLFTDSPSCIAVKSKALDVKAHGYYKLTLKAKVSALTSGNFDITISENDTILNKYNLKEDYTLGSFTKTASSTNSTNKYSNGYTTIELFIKAHDYYDSSVNLLLSLGSKETSAQGCVIIDNITLEETDYSSYSSASDKLTLSAYSNTPSFTNGYFNVTENADKTLIYPLKAQGYTSDLEENSLNKSGVIYLNGESDYNERYASYTWKGGYPTLPLGSSTPNNVYMMYNPSSSMQSLKTSSYNLAADKYYKLNFDVKTVSTGSKAAKITLEIVDGNDNTLFYQKGISASNWEKLEVQFHTNKYFASDVKAIVHFGEKDDNMQGYVYLDNFAVEESDEAAFAAFSNKVDFSDYYFKLDPKNEIGYNLTDAKGYTFETTGQGKGGIVSGDNNEFNITYENKNILVLSGITAGKSTLKSSYPLTVGSDPGYYNLSFELKTNFNVDEEAVKNNKDHECKYGVSVGLDGYTLASQLVSNERFNSYTIYFKVGESATPNFVFSLNCDCYETLGSAYLTNIAFSDATENEYTGAKENANYEKSIFTSVKESEDGTPTETPDDNTDNNDTTTDNNTTNQNNELWLIIPSVLFALAIIIAIIGFALRHVKIKKNVKTGNEEYDRSGVNREAVIAKAQKARDEEAEEIRNSIKAVEESRTALEEEHKAAIKESRLKGGKITKETEREFKAYAGKMARLDEKEAILKEQLSQVMTADHLIELEEKITSDEEKMLREMEKLQSGKKKTKDNE